MARLSPLLLERKAARLAPLHARSEQRIDKLPKHASAFLGHLADNHILPTIDKLFPHPFQTGYGRPDQLSAKYGKGADVFVSEGTIDTPTMPREVQQEQFRRAALVRH